MLNLYSRNHNWDWLALLVAITLRRVSFYFEREIVAKLLLTDEKS